MEQINNIKKYLPSKKFQKILGSFIIVFLVILFISLISSGKISVTKRQKEQAIIQKMTLNELVQKDTDSDGSPDWEEGLFGTDPYKSISNTEGVLDGLYIEKQKSAQGGSSEKLTESQKVAQDFFIAVEALRQSGNLTPTALYNITSSISSEMLQQELPETFSFTEVKTTPDTAENRKTYKNEFKNAHAKAVKKGLGKELGIFIQAMGEGNIAQLEKMTTYSDIYKNLASDLKKIKSPDEFSTNHYLLINHYERISKSLDMIKESFNDPIVGTKGIVGYKKWTEESTVVLKNIEILLKQYGIL